MSCSGGIPFLFFAELGAFGRSRVAGKAGTCLAGGVGRTLCGRRTGQCGEMGARRMADGFWPGFALSDRVGGFNPYLLLARFQAVHCRFLRFEGDYGVINLRYAWKDRGS